jgi:hypothetical protein
VLRDERLTRPEEIAHASSVNLPANGFIDAKGPRTTSSMRAKSAGNEWFSTLSRQQLFTMRNAARMFLCRCFERVHGGDKSCRHGMTIWPPLFLAFETKQARA